MKKHHSILLCATIVVLLLTAFKAYSRSIRIGGTPTREENVELVVQNQTAQATYIAERLKAYLGKVMGKELAIVASPSNNAISIIIGNCELSQAAGLNLSALPREGYYILRKGNQIFLAGRDTETKNPINGGFNQEYGHGTINAAMDFLERFADVRFFFPGEMGILVPEGTGLMLPPEIDIQEAPDYTFRRVSSGNSRYGCKWWEDPIVKGMNNFSIRQIVLRLGEFNIPYTHGLAQTNMIERFAESHPEYFALKPDGRRYLNPAERHPGQLCFNSGVVEEIYQDAKAYFQGKPSTERGIKSWRQAGRENFFCIMPQDSLYWCGCEKCAKIAPPAWGYNNNPEAAKRINTFMWQFTADIANRLAREGIEGVITQMPYGVMKTLPEVDLPENISVQLAVKGLGKREQWDEDKALIKQWHDKVKHPISLWTYPGKHMEKAAMKGIPATMFHQMGEYFQYMRPYLCGAYLEDETDFEIFNHIDFYIYSKISWNLDLSVKEILDDYYRHMYGSAAPILEAFFNEMEELWCNKVIGNSVDTAIGPVTKLPTDFEVWKNIYSPEKRQKWTAMFEKALKQTAKEPEAQKRVAFMKQEYLGRILNAGKAFEGRVGLINDWKVEVPGEVWLRAYKGEVNEVSTKVSIQRENGNFVFTYDCEEPNMEDIKEICTERDAEKTFSDSCVELLINPSGDRKNYYHFIANANGTLYDASYKLNEKPDIAWNCQGASATAVKREDGFTIAISIPEASIAPFKPEGFPVNFARNRSMKTIIVKEIYYQWSPVAGRSFHSIEQFGILCLTPQEKSINLLQDPDFQRPINNTWKPGNWNFAKPKSCSGEGQKCEMDKTVFLFGGQSPHVTNQTGQSFIVSQKFSGMEPNKQYRVSYYLRTKDIEPGPTGVGGWLVIGQHQEALPRTRITGTTTWHPQSFVITTKSDVTPETPCSFAIWNWKHKGEFWVDHVQITPVQ
ncbi:MAG: DUF4838 domain-containing protein [Victivallales bacterium]|nr:DUF4838 domain-containing protein [Victivallales bacterium]